MTALASLTAGYLLGRRLYETMLVRETDPSLRDNVPLDLVETRTFGSRVIYERYGRARDEQELRRFDGR